MMVSFDNNAVQFLTLRNVLDDVRGMSAVRWAGSLWNQVVAKVLYAAALDEVNNTMLYVSIDNGERWQRTSFEGLGRTVNASAQDQWYRYMPLVADDFVLVVAVIDPLGVVGESTLFVADVGQPMLFKRSLAHVQSLTAQSSLLYAVVDFEQLQGVDGLVIVSWFHSRTCQCSCSSSL